MKITEKKVVLSKSTLLFFLNNELGNKNSNIELTITLVDGAWCGRMGLTPVDTTINQDADYLSDLANELTARGLEEYKEKH